MNVDWRSLIVPGVMFLIWVVNQVMNKEINPAANRMPNPGGGLGPRPGGLPPAPRPASADPLARRPIPPPPSRRADNDDVIVIRDTSRPPGRPGSPPAPGRKGSRSRPAAQPTPRRAEPPPARKLAPLVSQRIETSLELTPLASASTAPAATEARPASTAPGPAPTMLALREAMMDPSRLREAYILNELLQPPLALRGRRHGR